ncbi:unnamed protein product, partial [Ectocarpus sp. 12 AP-2014]
GRCGSWLSRCTSAIVAASPTLADMTRTHRSRRIPLLTLAACIVLLQRGNCFLLIPNTAARSGSQGYGSTATATLHRAAAAPSPLSPARCRSSGVGIRRGRGGVRMMGGGNVAAAAEALEAEEKAEREALRARNDQEWQFFDTARINVKAGKGGNGCIATRREKGISMGGPNGGSGGRGGSIFLRCSEGLNTLAMVRHKVHYRATDGQNGQGKSRTGNSGADVYVSAPLGTVVRDHEGVLCGELTEHGQELLVARGGGGGGGNEAFKTSRSKIPMFGEKGEPGGERWLSMELKLVADVGFVGVPNAGKSTLLAVSSNAKPKIADYPFTTVTPNLGVCDVLGDEAEAGMDKGLVLADIPGLLEGAHEGVGLGLAFLRHVQRCRVLVHLVSGDSVDPVGDYRAIQQELELFSPKLLKKQQVVVLNKIDLPHVRSKQIDLV